MKNPYVLIGISIAAISLILFLGLAPEDVKVNYEMSQEDFMSLLTTFFFVALVAERLVEVVLGASRKPGKKKIEQEISDLESTTPINAQAIAQKKDELQIYRGETEVSANYISFGIGILVAASGFRILEALLDPSDINIFFRVVDILLSAGLIAGGSKGINAMTSPLGEFFDKIKEQQKQGN